MFKRNIVCIALQLNCEFKAFSINKQKNRNDALFSVCSACSSSVKPLCKFKPSSVFFLVSLYFHPLFCVSYFACVKPAQSPFQCYFKQKCSIEIKQANEKKNKLNLNISTSLAHSAMKIKSMGIRIHT